MAGPSKRVRLNDPDFEDTLRKWYEEDFSDNSDIEDYSEDYRIESEHDTNSEQSDFDEGDPQNTSLDHLSDADEPNQSEGTRNENSSVYTYGKNRYRWSCSEVQPSSKTRKHNIIMKIPALTAVARNLGDTADPLSVWGLLFSDNILQQIIEWTNKKLGAMRLKYEAQNKIDLRDVDIIELKAFMGLLIYTAIFNSNHEHIETIFATDGTGREIFRCVMSIKRFSILLCALRFDNPEDREERKKSVPAAAISFVFNTFVENCQSAYGLGQSATIDEMLVSFRGRCRFKMYMPNKPAKYGIKIQCLTDARNSYLYNAYIYTGKDSDGAGLCNEEKKLMKPTQAVIRLARPLFNSNRNITADNWYTSIQLVDILLKNKLTYVGTMKKNKPEIPPSFQPNKKREERSVRYGFREEKTLISYAGKKGKATILVSSMHDRVATDNTINKPEIISYYNGNKGGVDSLDEKCSKSSSSRRTRRWPMAIFFRVLDISVVNSYILHQCYKNNPLLKEKSHFAKQLAKQLVQAHMKRRMINVHVPREIRNSISRILDVTTEQTAELDKFVLEKRKICHLCPSKKRRMTKYLCLECRKPVCLQCTKPVCAQCIEKKC